MPVPRLARIAHRGEVHAGIGVQQHGQEATELGDLVVLKHDALIGAALGPCVRWADGFDLIQGQVKRASISG